MNENQPCPYCGYPIRAHESTEFRIQNMEYGDTVCHLKIHVDPKHWKAIWGQHQEEKPT